MLDTRVKVLTATGKEVEKLFTTGRVVRVIEATETAPIRFDLAVDQGKDKPTKFYHIGIRKNANDKFKEIVSSFEKGQQLFVELNVSVFEGREYFWLNDFSYGKDVRK